MRYDSGNPPFLIEAVLPRVESFHSADLASFGPDV
jgi:hypothetical protein